MRSPGSAPLNSLRLGIGLALLLSATPSLAYIDPNAGGLLYQILLPFIVAIAAGWRYLKSAFITLLRRFAGRPNRPAATPGDPAVEPQREPDRLP